MASFNLVFIVVTISLVVQLVVLFLLAYGYLLYRRLNLRKHGIIMAWSVGLHLTMVFALMVPSFVLAVFPYYIAVNSLELTSIISLFHEVTGAIALGLGVWFVAAWRFRKDFRGCFNRRRLMVVAIIVWLAALFFGIALYAILNWTILMG